MKAGDTFRFIGIADIHLWMIISDPALDPDRLVLVSFTSWDRLADQACIVDAGEHPFVTHRTCVEYGRAKVASDASLERLRGSGRLQLNTPLSAELLRRIRNAVMDSRMKLEIAQILIDQNLIE